MTSICDRTFTPGGEAAGLISAARGRVDAMVLDPDITGQGRSRHLPRQRLRKKCLKNPGLGTPLDTCGLPRLALWCWTQQPIGTRVAAKSPRPCGRFPLAAQNTRVFSDSDVCDEFSPYRAFVALSQNASPARASPCSEIAMTISTTHPKKNIADPYQDLLAKLDEGRRLGLIRRLAVGYTTVGNPPGPNSRC